MTTMLVRPQTGDIIIGTCQTRGPERTGRITEVLGPIPDGGEYRYRIDDAAPDRAAGAASVIVAFLRFGDQCRYCQGAIEMTDPSGRSLTDWRHVTSQASSCPPGTPRLHGSVPPATVRPRCPDCRSFAVRTEPEPPTFDLTSCPACGYEHRFATGA
ncbi:hypothetical protein BS329_15455 [Amycolatopsis coloradensis]|uniref:Uncharacterized protein n=1 Tax=Amycolatopsis coloradensis TaxID=76021 RepID=A0A1R0KU79_9PSEU|nr:hypothetical protein [Amycolatopsis coloradensis]OLZ51661.1 hypothetical protein BS329_15455 [Amycolatopsis coloradensis]